MNNFGVVELASTKTTSAPGWAYVPDRQQPLMPSAVTANRKRARAAASGGANQLSLADANARQEAKARREIEVLDRDNARDVHISIPVKNGIARTGGKKYTPNVRRILQSQKTFVNHLDDYIALQAQQAGGGGEGGSSNNNNNNTSGGGGSRDTTTPGATTSGANATSTRSGGQRQASISVGPASKKSSSTKQQQQQQPKKGEEESEDVEMLDQSSSDNPQTTDAARKKQKKSAILTSYPAHPAHPEDTSPLLASHLPPLPSDDELRALLDAPALSYLEARGTWPPQSLGDAEEGGQQRYPTRAFCALCGYWGRVRCMKCGTRVCALDCLETHREECITRYGL